MGGAGRGKRACNCGDVKGIMSKSRVFRSDARTNLKLESGGEGGTRPAQINFFVVPLHFFGSTNNYLFW